jgi:thioesterase domain-containing protein
LNTAEFLESLRQLGVQIRADGENLRVNAPTGVLNAERRELLALRKPEIIEFLNLAAKVREQQPAIVPLQPLGSKPPIFAAAGHNGDVFCYRALAQHLGPDQPFFGLQPRGYDPDTVPIADVTELAVYFAKQIMAFRPGKECILVGYCAGGTVAFELVRQLQAAGHPVKRLIFVGAPVSTWYRWPSYSLALGKYWVRRCAKAVRVALSIGGRKATRKLLQRISKAEDSDIEDKTLLARRRRVESITAKAVARYVPTAQDIHADIVLPARYVVQTQASLLQWAPFLRSHRSYICTDGCTNETMLLPANADHVAGAFVTFLTREPTQGVISNY